MSSDAAPATTRRLVVIGVGHRDRGDDGLGPAIVDALGHRADDDVVTIVREGDLAVLPLLWDAEDDVVIVDASVSTGPVGCLSAVDPQHLESSNGLSTHGLNVADAIELACRLDCLPARLRVFGVTGRDFRPGPMSRETHRLIEPVTDQLMELLDLRQDRSASLDG